jgi:hypothetical protein
VIGCAFTVLNTLGAGFLEKVYESAFAYEVRAAGLSAVQQYAATVHYKNILVGEYFADLLVNDVLLVELTTVNALGDATGCNAPIISKRPACSFACCLISASRAWRSNEWSMAYEPRCAICVFRVHRLPASALKFLLVLRCPLSWLRGPRPVTISARSSHGGSMLDRSQSLCRGTGA